MMGNVSNTNHFIHFIIGLLSFKFHYITGVFLLYQLIDGFKFKYKVIRDGKVTDDILLDLLFFCLGGLSMRYIYEMV
jgi:hypothetical protein